MSLIPTKSNKLKANRPIDRIPGAHQRQAQEPRSGNSLRVINPIAAVNATLTAAARAR